MKTIIQPVLLSLISLSIPFSNSDANDRIPNRLIDYSAFQQIVIRSASQRETNRLTEQDYLNALSEKGILLLDARSHEKYALRHIDGAVNLPFTEFTEETLAAIIPTKAAKILIYCNNNFEGSPAAFPAKNLAASLNVSTQASLRAYGYENIYELGPLLDVKTTKIPFAGTEVTLDVQRESVSKIEK